MVKSEPVCAHLWMQDMDELRCFYCGRRLYRNRDPSGPTWIPPIPVEEINEPGYNIDNKRGTKWFKKE